MDDQTWTDRVGQVSSTLEKVKDKNTRNSVLKSVRLSSHAHENEREASLYLRHKINTSVRCAIIGTLRRHEYLVWNAHLGVHCSA